MLPVPEQRKHCLHGSLQVWAVLVASLQRPSSEQAPLVAGGSCHHYHQHSQT